MQLRIAASCYGREQRQQTFDSTIHLPLFAILCSCISPGVSVDTGMMEF
jgi:hypothetical protein